MASGTRPAEQGSGCGPSGGRGTIQAVSKPTDVDALLLVSFGGPEGPDDVLPFLRNVTRGRNVPDERLAEVAERYLRFGGRSPINDANRALLAALRAELDLPVYWGNRNWAPYLADALARMRADGIRRAACFVTSAFASYSGCRQYREDLAAALAQVGPGAPELIKLRLFFAHPGFVEPMVDNTVAALASLPEAVRDRARLVFTAHSLPLSQAETSGPDGGAYVRQLLAVAAVVADRVEQAERAERAGSGPAPRRGWDLAYCSRSGPPTAAWLEPDVGDRLAELAKAGVEAAVIIPLGFVSDHMEVVYDLDVEAAGTARAHGMAVARAATVGTDPRFVAMVGELIEERRHPERERRALTAEGPSHDVCPLRCCEPRVRRPAAAGVPADLAARPGGADGAARGADGRAGG